MNRFGSVLALVLSFIVPSIRAEVIQYRYDAGARLDRVDYGNGVVQSFVYDRNGNVERREMSVAEEGDQAPGVPVLLSPGNGDQAASPVRLEWVASTDPEGSAVSYRVYCALDGVVLDSTTPTVVAWLEGLPSPSGAGDSRTWRAAAVVSMLFLGAGLFLRRRTLPFVLAAFILIGMTACGGGGGGDGGSVLDVRSTTLSDLETGKTYRWKVVAIDEAGLSSQSVEWIFTVM